MPSKESVGAAPLITGIVLAFQSSQEIIIGGSSLWSVFGLIGGCAAIVVGLDILSGWSSRTSEAGKLPYASNATLLGLVIFSIVAGAAVTLL